jgi:hypothetical protein
VVVHELLARVAAALVAIEDDDVATALEILADLELEVEAAQREELEDVA